MKLNYLVIFGMALLLASCNSNDNSTDEVEVPLSVKSFYITDRTTKQEIPFMNSMGVFRLAENGYTAINNAKYDYKSVWGSTNPIYLRNAEATLCFCFPYGSAGITNSTDITSVTLTSQEYSKSEDLCYVFSKTSGGTDLPSKFIAKHAYSMLAFEITVGTYIGKGNITNISISNPDIRTSAKLDMTKDLYYDVIKGTVSYDPHIPSILPGDIMTANVLIVPVDYALNDDITVTMTVDGKIMTGVLSKSILQKGIQSGNCYTIGIKLQGSLDT